MLIPFTGIVGDHVLDSVGPVWYVVFGITANLLLVGFALRKKSLSSSGGIATFFVGVTVFTLLGVGGWLILIIFFVSCTIIGKISRPAAERVSSGIQKKGGCRDYMQVFANGGPATAAAILYAMTGDHIYLVAFGAAIAESNADTWAGEIGILSESQPVSIINFQPVETGLSGGVTVLGTAASFVGSSIIAASWYYFFSRISGDYDWSTDAVLIAITGFIGGLVDSVLGATIQVHYYDEENHMITEHETKNGKRLPIVRGVQYIDNDMVNLMSNIYSMIMAYFLYNVLSSF